MFEDRLYIVCACGCCFFSRGAAGRELARSLKAPRKMCGWMCGFSSTVFQGVRRVATEGAFRGSTAEDARNQRITRAGECCKELRGWDLNPGPSGYEAVSRLPRQTLKTQQLTVTPTVAPRAARAPHARLGRSFRDFWAQSRGRSEVLGWHCPEAAGHCLFYRPALLSRSISERFPECLSRSASRRGRKLVPPSRASRSRRSESRATAAS